MKKLFNLTISLILVLSIFSSCSLFAHNETDRGTNTETETDTKTETSTETDTKTETTTETETKTETSTDTDDSKTKVYNANMPTVTYKTVKKSYYEKVLYYFGQYEYVASDLPNDFGDYYKVLKTYDDFS